MFHIRHKALEIVDFYRNFTVEVTGVGDVCSFAQMDIRRHGNPQVSLEEYNLKIALEFVGAIISYQTVWRSCTLYTHDMRQATAGRKK